MTAALKHWPSRSLSSNTLPRLDSHSIQPIDSDFPNPIWSDLGRMQTKWREYEFSRLPPKDRSITRTLIAVQAVVISGFKRHLKISSIELSVAIPSVVILIGFSKRTEAPKVARPVPPAIVSSFFNS